MVERKTLNLVVAGSIPAGGAYIFGVRGFESPVKLGSIPMLFINY